MKNKNKLNLILFLPCLLAGFFVFAKVSVAEEKSIIISAVKIQGEGTGNSNDDFIEIYNTTCKNIDLSDYKIKRRIEKGGEKDIGTLKNIIPAKGYYLWENISKNLSDNPDYSTRSYTLSTNYSIALFNSSGDQIDSITWGINLNPFTPTIQTINPVPAYYVIRRDENNNILYEHTYSPKNSTFIETAELEKCPLPEEAKEEEEEEEEDDANDEIPQQTSISPKTLRINEIFPNPSQKGEENEYIEIYNYGQEAVLLENIILLDRNKKECPLKIFTDSLAPATYLLVENKKHSDCKITVQNSKASFDIFDSSSETTIFTAGFTVSAKEDLSYNFDGSNWRWSNFLTPGAENIFNNAPTAKTDVPKKAYKNSFVEFFARGSDQDKDKLKYTWDFGDGHKSYKAETRHKYKNSGKYSVTLKISDGTEDKIKNFEIKIEKFPKLDINIIGLSPNPAGSDTDVEYILLKNATKKKVNLNGWSIATGNKKKMINHPINLDLILKPKQEFKLTHLYSKFSLNNTGSTIELRYPNGKVASKVSYKAPGKSVPDDATYEKIQGSWTWKFPVVRPAILPGVSGVESPTEISIQQPPAKTAQQLAEEAEVQNNLGKFSPEPELAQKKQTRFSLLNFGLHIQTANAFTEPSPRDYFSDQELPARKHWAVQLMDDLFFKINSWMNSIL